MHHTDHHCQACNASILLSTSPDQSKFRHVNWSWQEVGWHIHNEWHVLGNFRRRLELDAINSLIRAVIHVVCLRIQVPFSVRRNASKFRTLRWSRYFSCTKFLRLLESSLAPCACDDILRLKIAALIMRIHVLYAIVPACGQWTSS